MDFGSDRENSLSELMSEIARLEIAINADLNMISENDHEVTSEGETDRDRGRSVERVENEQMSLIAGASPPVTLPHPLTVQNVSPRVTFPPPHPTIPVTSESHVENNVDLRMMRVPNAEETRAISQLRAWISHLNLRDLLVVMDSQRLNTIGHDNDLRDRMLRYEIRAKISRDLARWSETEDHRQNELPLTWPVTITEPAIEEFIDATPTHAQRSLPPATLVPSLAGNPYSRATTPLPLHQVPTENNTYANIGGRDIQYTHTNHTHVEQHEHMTHRAQTRVNEQSTRIDYTQRNEQVSQRHEIQMHTNHTRINEFEVANDYRRLAEQNPYDGQMHRETHLTHNDNTHTITHVDSSNTVNAHTSHEHISTAYVPIAPVSGQNVTSRSSLEEAGPRKGTVTFADAPNVIETPQSSTPTRRVENRYTEQMTAHTSLRSHLNPHINTQHSSLPSSQTLSHHQSFPSNPSHAAQPFYQSTPAHPPPVSIPAYQSHPVQQVHNAPRQFQSLPPHATRLYPSSYQNHATHYAANPTPSTQQPPPPPPLPPPNTPYAHPNLTHTVSSHEYVHEPLHRVDAPGSAVHDQSEYAPTKLTDLTLGFLPYGEENALRSGTHSYRVGKCGTYLRTLEVSFDGTNGDADELLRRVKDAAEIHGLSDEETIGVLPYVLDGQALNWFRTDRRNCRRYADLVQRFRLRFSSLDSESRIREEIRTRTQGLDEPLAPYLTTLQILFSRLRNPGPIEAQLDVAFNNLHPKYMAVIDRSSIASYEEFLLLGHQFEEKWRRMAAYVPPKAPGKYTISPTSQGNNDRRNGRLAAMGNESECTADAHPTPHNTPRPSRPKKTRQTRAPHRPVYSLRTNPDPPCSTGAVEEEVMPTRLLQDLWAKYPAESRHFAEVQINARKFRALIDSGATRTFVGPRVGKELRQYVIAAPGSIKVANGEQAETSGGLVMRLKSRGVECVLPMRIAPVLAYDIILGMDFIAEMDVEIRGKNVTWGKNATQRKSDNRNESRIIVAKPIRTESMRASHTAPATPPRPRTRPAPSLSTLSTTHTPTRTTTQLQKQKKAAPIGIGRDRPIGRHRPMPSEERSRRLPVQESRKDVSTERRRRLTEDRRRGMSTTVPLPHADRKPRHFMQPLMDVQFPPDFNPFLALSLAQLSQPYIPPLMSLSCTPPENYRRDDNLRRRASRGRKR